MGTNVYIANSLNQDVYVLPAEKTGWMLADLGFNVATLFAGVGEIRDVVLLKELPQALDTVKDLYNFLKIMAALGGGMYKVGSGATKVSTEVLAQFKSNSIKVPAQQVVDILNQSSFSNYTSFSGIFASLFDADTFNLLTVTDDGAQVALVSTNPDYSWIVESDRVVRSVYGTTRTPNPSAGLYLFNTGCFVPPGSYQQTSKDVKVTLTCNPAP
jgi:hypothetical protein